MKQGMKRAWALLLALAMLLSIAACGKQQESASADGEYSRAEMELIVDMLGDGQSTADMTDQQLEELVDRIVREETDTAQLTQLSNTAQEDLPKVDTSANGDAYDENGAMTKPFDQVYPELIEQEQVAFSGESILVKLASDKLTDGLKAAGIGALEKIVPLDKAAWYEAGLLAGIDAGEALAAVRELDEVLLAEFNYEVQTNALDDYKHFDGEQEENFKKNGHNKDQWHFHHCGIPDGYGEMEKDGGDPSVIVAVIDSGVDYTHEDLRENMWVNTKEIPDNGRDDDNNGYVDDYYGVDIVSGTGNGDDTNGHGTHVAGIVAARNNNVGVLGIAYNVKIMSVKAAAHNGTFNQADIARAVLYAYENGAEVINMSFGGTACSIAVQDALATAYTRCVLVASAGNSGMPNEGELAMPNYPAALSYVLGVMSVDENGKESSFTNYDTFAFNGVEYELYAPGENIMSTLPGNSYGYLSGTSMAAPVVASFAAILRSEFDDRDQYPTKFIYGQLASTSGIQADCLDPEKHYGHNIPQVVDLNAALTKLPKPEVNLQDYALFDDPKYSSANNGDGVIDAGETIALGLTLQNRWGMSKNTLVTVDTLSDISGLPDPYITIQNPTVDYGSVGTYSTQDCGRIYTDEILTGWEKPFLITVSEDCPNDYRFTLHVTITCENAIDGADTTVYSSTGEVQEAVRSGTVLPSIIDEDMVLTKDNLYIIPNSTVIQEGVTVRVLAGTRIQFWSDDPSDPYADKYIASLSVKGELLVEGTKEEPVLLYPSELMNSYNVDIGAKNKGEIHMTYADVTNLYNENAGGRITTADHCTFRISMRNRYYRYLSSGKIYNEELYSGGFSCPQEAKDCIFYKLYGGTVSGNCSRCIFVDSKLSYGNATMRDCVFLGNSFLREDGIREGSSKNVQRIEELSANDIYLYYNPENGSTYVRVSNEMDNYDGLEQYMAEAFGGGFAIFETKEEYSYLIDPPEGANIGMIDVKFKAGITWDETLGKHLWSDGTPVGDFVSVEKGVDDPYIGFGNDWGTTYTLYEIPGRILPTDITFREYEVNMDLGAVYRIAPENEPIQLPADSFLYESSDETVLTVSRTGLVTPVGLGTAEVTVRSLDKAVSNYITFHVKEYVPLTGLELGRDTALLAAGQTMEADCRLTPANTTRTNVVYTSSNADVATVDEFGNITGIASGKATITAACEGITDTMEVTVYVRATTLSLSVGAMTASLDDGPMDLPQVITSDGAETELSWRSTDESIAVVEDGRLILKDLGTTALVVTDSRSGLSASALVVVQANASAKVKQMHIESSTYAALLEDGSVYAWNGSSKKTPSKIEADAVAIGGSDNMLMIARKDGTIVRWSLSSRYQQQTITHLQGKKLVDVDQAGMGTGNYFALAEDGTVYAWGSNSYGCLGVGFEDEVDTPIALDLKNVVQVESGYSNMAWFRTAAGELYVTGYFGGKKELDPKLVDTNVVLLAEGCGDEAYYLRADGRICSVGNGSTYVNASGLNIEAPDAVALNRYNTGLDGLILKDGLVYTIGNGDNGYVGRQVTGITDAVGIFSDGNTHYAATQSGMLLNFGAVSGGSSGGMTTDSTVTVPVAVPLSDQTAEELVITGSNLADGALVGTDLQLRFNKALTKASPKLYVDGTQVAMSYELTDTNCLHITRSSGFAADTRYELLLPAGTVVGMMGVTNSEDITLTFTGDPDPADPDQTEQTPESEAPVIHQSVKDSSIQRYWTEDSVFAALQAHRQKTQLNPRFMNNAILNPISTNTNVEQWLRLLAPETEAEIPLGRNYWGTANATAVGLQVIDYADFTSYAQIMYTPYLTEAPESTYPFVTDIQLFNKYGDEVTTVGNEQITFRVSFNRDMDTSIPLQVRFGSAFPYGDYEIAGKYVDARTWEGTYTLNTFIENGYQYFTVSNGCSAVDDLVLQTDQYRFFFEIDTTAAQALMMQGTATDTGIELKWTQDDFNTLMGYNVYRSTKEDGQYTRLNKTVIPADTMQWFDDGVEPGQVYYYNFTVVQTDLTESEPSGKISIMAKDTMAPNIYHSPVADAFTGANLLLDATITDNLNIAYANLYYRVTGGSWNTVRMNKLNDKYSAIIPAAYVTTAGIEYYIEAFDGVSTTLKGSKTTPFTVTVREAVAADALGDVDGDGSITNLDALLLLYTINDKYNMKPEEFARADLNGDGSLQAAEALRILQYVSGVISSVKM